MRSTNRLYLYLSPILVLAVLFISVNQQNTLTPLASSDDDYDVILGRVDSLNKIAERNISSKLIIDGWILSKENTNLLLLPRGKTQILVSLEPGFKNQTCLNERAPPEKIIV